MVSTVNTTSLAEAGQVYARAAVFRATRAAIHPAANVATDPQSGSQGYAMRR